MKYLIACSIFLCSAVSAGIDLRGGVGYSALSQRFVLFEEDTVSSSGEGKIFFEGSAGSPFGMQGIRANWMLSGGTSSFYGRGGGRWTHLFNDDLSLVSQASADIRSPYDKDVSSGYFKGLGSMRIRKKWDDRSVAGFAAFEGKTYSGESGRSYDYSLTRFRVEFSNPFLGNDQLGVAWQFAFRFAPDTVEANYIRNNFYFHWDKFWMRNYIRANVEAERRVNNNNSPRGDYWQARGYINPQISAGNRLTLSPKLYFEGWRYDWADDVYPNREVFDVDGCIEWEINAFLRGRVAPSFLISHAEEAVKTDNYREFSVETGLDWLRHKKIWLYGNAEIGRRIYADEPPEIFALYSDFIFVEWDVFLTWWIRDDLKLDIITSYSPEWHAIKDDDITTFYLSTNLRYEFFTR